MLTSTLLSMIWRVISDRRVAGGGDRIFRCLPCDIYPGFVQLVIQDISLALFTTVPLSGRLLVHFIVGQLLLLATFEIDFSFQGGCGYIPADHSTDLPYDKFTITTVDCNTWETSLVHCLKYCYFCLALVSILSNELVIFPSITLYYGNNYIIYINRKISIDITYMELASARPNTMQVVITALV